MQVPHIGPKQSQDEKSKSHKKPEQKQTSTKLDKTTTTTTTTTTTRMHIWWFHIIKGSVKASKDHAKNMGYKCTSRED